MRAYTVHELDALKQVVEQRMTFGTTGPFRPGERYRMGQFPSATALWECVRTHMLAGHTAQDIRDADNSSQEIRKA